MQLEPARRQAEVPLIAVAYIHDGQVQWTRLLGDAETLAAAPAALQTWLAAWQQRRRAVCASGRVCVGHVDVLALPPAGA